MRGASGRQVLRFEASARVARLSHLFHTKVQGHRREATTPLTPTNYPKPTSIRDSQHAANTLALMADGNCTFRDLIEWQIRWFAEVVRPDPGIYLLHFEMEGYSETKKIIITD